MAIQHPKKPMNEPIKPTITRARIISGFLLMIIKHDFKASKAFRFPKITSGMAK
ncbi:hypothetical protein D3C85_1538910 [compost metagenome]